MLLLFVIEKTDIREEKILREVESYWNFEEDETYFLKIWHMMKVYGICFFTYDKKDKKEKKIDIKEMKNHPKHLKIKI